MRKSCVAVVVQFALLMVLLTASRSVFAAPSISWSAPSSVNVGQKFTVRVSIDGSSRCPDQWEGPVTYEGESAFKAYAPGEITFTQRYTVGSYFYFTHTTVTAVDPSPTLSSVDLEVSSGSAVPGDSVYCYLYAYSRFSETIYGGTKSWQVSSITNDTISSSGVVKVSPAQVSRTITVTGSYSYNGVTKSESKTITVTRVPIALESVTLSAPTNVVAPGSTIPLAMVANSYYDGPITSGLASWRILPNEFDDAVSSEGVVSISNTNVSRNVQVVCDYTYAGVTKSGVIELQVLSRCDTPVISPVDGTIFDSSLSVSMSCGSEGSVIRYTMDGSNPMEDSPVYKKFKITGKTTIKAAAFNDDGNRSEAVTASYALGRCADPVVSPVDGTVFKRSGQIVTIDKNGEEGVLRYTTDGTDPTRESPVYEGPLAVDDSTVVKAKVFSDRYFDSAVVTVNLTREWESVATPVITAAEEFTGGEAKVMIACATSGAVIRYTTDGSEPTSDSSQYAGPFWVDESCTVKVVAMCADYLTSEVASRTITKVWGIGDTMGAPDHAFATSGDAGFVRVEDATAPKGEAMRSGEIGDSAGYGLYSRSVLSTTVQGPCTLKFKWRCSCEEDDGFEWDHAEFAVDGEIKARINGIMDGWAELTQVITEDGTHAVTWTYLKDSSEKDGADCLWVADYSWTPTELYTHESSVPVPYDWIRTYLPHTAYEYDHFEAAVRETAANGVNTVEEAYVAGLDPSDPKDKFIAKIEMVDGKSVVTWTPDMNEDGAKSVRTYKTWGKDSLDADEWFEVTPENQDDMRFFKVTVGMP